MGRASRRKQQIRAHTAFQQTQSPQKARLSWKIKAMAGFFVAAISLVSALMSFQPKFGVTLGEAFKPGDISSIPFEFLNDSPYPVHWVRHSWELYGLILADGEKVEDLRTFPAFHRQETLDNGQAKTLFCPMLGEAGLKATAADVGLRVTYKPWFSPFEQSKEFRFNIGPDPSGKLHAFRRNDTDEHIWSF